jgi:hypothetical protein
MITSLNEQYLSAVLADRKREAQDASWRAEVSALKREAREQRAGRRRRRARWLRRSLIAVR